MAAAGAADGRYDLGALEVDVVDAVARLAKGGAIAGSTLTQDAALRRAVAAGVPLADAVAALTSTPARAIGRAGDLGALAPGFLADAVLLTADLGVEGAGGGDRWLIRARAGNGAAAAIRSGRGGERAEPGGPSPEFPPSPPTVNPDGSPSPSTPVPALPRECRQRLFDHETRGPAFYYATSPNLSPAISTCWCKAVVRGENGAIARRKRGVRSLGASRVAR